MLPAETAWVSAPCETKGSPVLRGRGREGERGDGGDDGVKDHWCTQCSSSVQRGAKRLFHK